MSNILKKLWQKVWDQEEAAKRRIYDETIRVAVAAATQEAEVKRRELTYIQKLCMKHGGPERQYEADFGTALTLPGGIAQQKAQYQAMLHAMQQQNVNPIYSGTGTYTQLPNSLTTSGTAGIGSVIGSSTNIGGYQPYSWPVLGNGIRDIFFMALKGIEDAASAKPEGNHPYDDFGYGIQDLRKLDSSRISLLGLASFCLSNLMEVEPLVILLEGHGFTVVDE